MRMRYVPTSMKATTATAKKGSKEMGSNAKVRLMASLQLCCNIFLLLDTPVPCINFCENITSLSIYVVYEKHL